MRPIDFSPLYRSTVGFDRLFNMLDGIHNNDQGANSYPPYNIERTGENSYRITMAVAGFSDQDIAIEAKESTLSIKGEKPSETDQNYEMLFQGIANRSFERRFQLADHVEIKSAVLENGLLHINLAREIPEALKARSIPISTNAGSAAKSSKQIEAKTAKK
jgi:molecular chaperone IbpA